MAVASGSLRASVEANAHLPHKWSAEGVAVHTAFTGGHLMHLAIAACALNNVHRAADSQGVSLDGVRVEATGTFATEPLRSAGIEYRVEIDSSAPAADVARVLATVDEVSEIPQVLRAGVQVQRIE